MNNGGFEIYNNIIDKYIKKVTKNMGIKQREEVARELRTHILDSADAIAAEKNVKVDDAIIREVILRMGPASEVADLYPEEKTLLDKTIFALKVVGLYTFIFAVAFGIVWNLLRIYFKNLQFDSTTIIVVVIFYLVFLAIYLILRFKLISKLIKRDEYF